MMDEKKRLAQYHRINKLWIEEVPAIPLYQQIDLYGANKRLAWKARSDELIRAYDMALKDGKYERAPAGAPARGGVVSGARGRNSVAECQLPKLDVAGSNPVGRSTSRGHGASP